MGYGDFKLLAALGAWLGWQMLPVIVLLLLGRGRADRHRRSIVFKGRDHNVPAGVRPLPRDRRRDRAVLRARRSIKTLPRSLAERVTVLMCVGPDGRHRQRQVGGRRRVRRAGRRGHRHRPRSRTRVDRAGRGRATRRCVAAFGARCARAGRHARPRRGCASACSPTPRRARRLEAILHPLIRAAARARGRRAGAAPTACSSCRCCSSAAASRAAVAARARRRLPGGRAGAPRDARAAASPTRSARDHGHPARARRAPRARRRRARQCAARSRRIAPQVARARPPLPRTRRRRARQRLNAAPRSGQNALPHSQRRPAPLVIRYEHPLNERIRTLMRLEDLFARAQLLRRRRTPRSTTTRRCSRCSRSPTSPRAPTSRPTCCRSSSARSRCSRRCARIRQIEQRALEALLAEIDARERALLAQAGKVGAHLRDNEWLMTIKQRTAIPGGVCEFDLPAYHYWLHRRPGRAAQRPARAGSSRSLPIHDGLAIILRSCATTAARAATPPTAACSS